MGCVIAAPCLYANLTASQNLEYYRIQHGIPGKSIVQKTLELVNLTDTGKTKVRTFTVDMKQRLGLALAILNSPDFIILDEPLNGLDPINMIAMRHLLKQLNEQGITILISSHLLTELSHIATKYALIHHGVLAKSITREQLREECKRTLLFTVDNTAKAAVILETVLNIYKYKQIGEQEFRVYDSFIHPSELIDQFAQRGVLVASLREVGGTLEDYFIKIVGEETK
jgi:ABC-2 type transport system ATP-binding protein